MMRRAGIGAVVLSGILVVLSQAASGAGAVGGSTSRTKDGSNRPRGATVMVASAACPGLGQLLNGKEPKAAIVSAVETFLVAGLIIRINSIDIFTYPSKPDRSPIFPHTIRTFLKIPRIIASPCASPS